MIFGLRAAAPTQSEPAFALTQPVVLLLLITLAITRVLRLRREVVIASRGVWEQQAANADEQS